MNILLLENSPGCGRQLKQELEARGHHVTWIIGVAFFEVHGLQGLLPSLAPNNDLFGVESDADLSRTAHVDLTQFEFAFCDGRLIGPVVAGQDVLPVLLSHGIVCCGTHVSGNPMLMAAGAHMCISKLFLMRAIRQGVLDPQKAIVDPAGTARALEEFAQRGLEEMNAARRQKRRIPTGFDCIDSLE